MTKSEEIMQKIQKPKVLLIIASIFIALLILIWIFLVWNENCIRKFDASVYQIENAYDGYVVGMDIIETTRDEEPRTKDYIRLSGFLLKPGEDTGYVSMKMILKNISTGEYYRIPTVIDIREGMAEKIGDENQYLYSGFTVKIPFSKKIDTEKYDYEILMLYDLNGTQHLVDFNSTIKTWGQ